jgi:hypothetical protein
MGDQLERLRAIVSRVTYKPRWRLGVWDQSPPYHQHAVLYVTYFAPNALCPENEVPLMLLEAFSLERLETLPDEYILREIYRLVRRAELHELDEWLKVDGKCVTDPHPEIKFRGLSPHSGAV